RSAGTHPGVTTSGAPGIEAGLGRLDGDVVGQGPPPALRGGVNGLLDHALAVAASWWTDRDLHAVVLGDRGERRADLPGLGMTDRGHPIKAPLPAQPAELACGRIEGVDQVSLVLDR